MHYNSHLWTIYVIRAKKPQFMACVPSGRLVVGPWVTNTREEVDLVHEQSDAPDNLAWSVGARAGAVQPGWGGRTGLPLTFGSSVSQYTIYMLWVYQTYTYVKFVANLIKQILLTKRESVSLYTVAIHILRSLFYRCLILLIFQISILLVFWWWSPQDGSILITNNNIASWDHPIIENRENRSKTRCNLNIYGVTTVSC